MKRFWNFRIAKTVQIFLNKMNFNNRSEKYVLQWVMVPKNKKSKIEPTQKNQFNGKSNTLIFKTRFNTNISMPFANKVIGFSELNKWQFLHRLLFIFDRHYLSIWVQFIINNEKNF